MGKYRFDEETGEASGDCSACGEPCVQTDNFGRDNCVKIVDETQQVPKVLEVFCDMRCMWNFFYRQATQGA